MRLRRPAVVALVVLGALAFAGSAQACSCARIASDEALRESDAAIVAKLVGVVPLGATQARFRYEVRRVFRGAAVLERGQTISIRSARSSAACGLPADQDRPVGLFLTHSEGGWAAGLCSMIAPRQLWTAARGGPAARDAASSPDCAT